MINDDEDVLEQFNLRGFDCKNRAWYIIKDTDLYLNNEHIREGALIELDDKDAIPLRAFLFPVGNTEKQFQKKVDNQKKINPIRKRKNKTTIN